MSFHEEVIKLHSDHHALINVETFKSEFAYLQHLMHFFAYTQIAKLAKEKMVLDVGCNIGYGTEILSRTSKMIVGADVSQDAIAMAHKKYGDTGIKFQKIDGKKLPYDDGSFDLVVGCQLIEHIVEIDLFVEDVSRVLSSEGIAVFSTPNASIRVLPGMKPWNEFHVKEFTHSELKDFLRKHFKYVDVYGLFADEAIETIVKDQYKKAMLYAKKQTTPTILQSIFKYFKRAVPKYVVEKISEALSCFEAQGDFDTESGYSIGEFYYAKNNLDTALDFMVVCSNKEINGVQFQREAKADVG